LIPSCGTVTYGAHDLRFTPFAHHARSVDGAGAALRRLDGALADRHWLVGDHFDVADLNVAAVLSPSRVQSMDFLPYEHVRTWLARCYGRPAAVATRRRFHAYFA
jgi:glutathione S-transferase